MIYTEDKWITEKVIREDGCDVSAGSKNVISDKIHDILTDESNWSRGYCGDVLYTDKCVKQIMEIFNNQ